MALLEFKRLRSDVRVLWTPCCAAATSVMFEARARRYARPAALGAAIVLPRLALFLAEARE